VNVNPEFVHHPGKEASDLEEAARSPDTGKFYLEKQDGKMIFRRLKQADQ